MKIRLLTVSHRQPAWVAEACAEYQKRLPREWGFEMVEVKPEARGNGSTAEKVHAAEAQRVRAALPKGPHVLVALDERGEAWTTEQFAARLGKWQQEGRDVALVIGGADGMASELLAGAAHRLALSAMTLPHGLCRVVLVEQLYRAATLLAGHPYHRR